MLYPERLRYGKCAAGTTGVVDVEAGTSAGVDAKGSGRVEGD